MKTNHYIYIHKKASNGDVFYVGQGSNKRAWSKDRRNDLWKNIVKKHGYIVEIVKESLTKNEANKLEIELIAKYGRKDLNLGNLCNMTDGGDGGTPGKVVSQKTKNKLKNVFLKMRSTLDYKNSVSGEKNSFFGKKHSEETKQIMAQKASLRIGDKNILSKKVICVEKGTVFSCLREAVESIKNQFPKANHAPISLVCNGQRKSAYGYTWEYV